MQLLSRVAEVLEKAEIPFAVVGVSAMAVYSVCRSTQDVDWLTIDQRALKQEAWTSRPERDHARPGSPGSGTHPEPDHGGKVRASSAPCGRFAIDGKSTTPSIEASGACFEALQQAADREPEYGPVWSALASFHCEIYAFDAPCFDRPLETAMNHARRGVSLDPGSQLSRMVLARALLLTGDLAGYKEEAETALSLNPNSSFFTGCAGYLFFMMGEFDHGRNLMDRVMAMNPCHPSWYHELLIFDFYRRRDYESAYLAAEKHRPFVDFWGPVFDIALLGKLGRADEAQAYIEEFEQLKPDFASRAREMFSRSCKAESFVDELMDGLRRGGLAVER